MNWIGFFIGFLTLIFGTFLGSFLHCAAYRIARREDFVHGRSRCPHCGHILSMFDLVPLLSYFMLRGHCRYCNARIPARYPLSEAVFALLCLGLYLRFGLSLVFFRNLFLTGCLFCLALVDLECYRIPDGCVLLALLAFLVTSPFIYGDWKLILSRVLCMFVYCAVILLMSLFMDWLSGKRSLGGGDVKLMSVMALYLGYVGMLFYIFVACLLGLIYVIFLRRGFGKHIPFGPCLAASGYFMLLFGEQIASWYLSVL